MNMKSKKYNIGIIANPVADKGKNVYLAKTIEIFKPLTNEIFVIDGDFPEVPDKRVHIIKIKADEKMEPILIRTIKAILTQLRFSLSLIKISEKTDIVIFFSVANTIPIILAKLMRKRTIVITGGSAWKSADKVYRGRLFGLGGFVFPLILRTLEEIGLIFSDRIAVESKSAVKFLGFEKYRDKISIISNMYLDINKFKIKKDLDSRRNLIGFISRLEEGKGIMNFVKAIPLILRERSDLEFLIGGDGQLFTEIRNELKNNKELNNKVELTGWIPHGELPDNLNELKLLVFPSYSEGLPNIVSESMACGTPVLATPVGGVPDLIKDGETGFIIEDNTPECIAKNVIRALSYPDLDRIVKNARKLIEEEYTYEAAVERYRKILGKSDKMNASKVNNMKISIIGSGFVGTAIGKGLIELGNEVLFYDVVDRDLPNFTKDINHAIKNSNVSFTCVPTPTRENGEINLSYIKEATKNIGIALSKKDEYHLVVVKSTVVLGTTESAVIPILEKFSGKRAREGEIGVCMNPEFLTEISGSWSKDEGMKKDFFIEDRIVIGEYDKKSGNMLESLYEPLNKPIFRTDLKTAELIKYASNCMLATKISYWNEIFLICKELGINSQTIANIVSLDPRIGKYGSVHGKAFGGKCLPKDLKAFVSFAEKYHKVKLLKAVSDINEEIKKKYGVRE